MTREDLPSTDADSTSRRTDSQELQSFREGPLSLNGICVLLIEDTLDMRRLIGRTLSMAGARVFTASSAQEARTLLTEIHPDVIVSDIAMPEEDGIAFIRGLRCAELEVGHHIPAVALTAFTSQGLKETSLRAGFEAHLCKPVSTAKLINTILYVVHNAIPGWH